MIEIHKKILRILVPLIITVLIFTIFERDLWITNMRTPLKQPRLAVLKGDVNNDGNIDIQDTLLISQYFIGLDPSNFNPEAADFNEDGFINILDALIVSQQYTSVIRDTGTPDGVTRSGIVGEVWFSTMVEQKVGDYFETKIYVNCKDLKLGAYGLVIMFDQNVVEIEDSEKDIMQGSIMISSLKIDNINGKVKIAGFDTFGVGPNTELHILTIKWHAVGIGNSLLDLTIEHLVDLDTQSIGTPQGIDEYIIVASTNTAPEAIDDFFDTDEGIELIVPAPGIMANDNDADGDSIEVTLVESPIMGSLVLNPDGSFTYLPSSNLNGIDTFTYNLSDGMGDFDIATVTININAINDAPIAIDDGITTDEDIAIIIDVLANDIDVDGDFLNVESILSITSGTVIINSDGTITYIPYIDLVGIATFEYLISDGQGGFDSAVCTITILDKTPPVTSYIIVGTLGNNDWFVTDVTITLVAADLYSDIYITEILNEFGAWIPYTGPLIFSNEGSMNIYYRSIDSVGNIEPTQDVTIKIDKTAPETELIVTDGFPDDNNIIHVTYDSTFTIIGIDESSGLYQSFYRVNNGNWIEFIDYFSLDGNPGEYVIEYYSVDLAENKEAFKSTNVILETEFEEIFRGSGILYVAGQKFIGLATLSVSKTIIQMEIEDQIIIWNVKCNYKFRTIEIYSGEGELGIITVIIISCKSFSYVIAFGNGVIFIGTS